MRASIFQGGRGHFSLIGHYSSFISAFNLLQVCLTWYVFTSTHSASDVGLVAIIETITVMVVSLPTGAYVDRVNNGLVRVIANGTERKTVTEFRKNVHPFAIRSPRFQNFPLWKTSGEASGS